MVGFLEAFVVKNTYVFFFYVVDTFCNLLKMPVNTSSISKKNNTNSSTSNLYCSPVAEQKKYNQSLHQRTQFHSVNTYGNKSLSHVILAFRFRSIEFSKKRALPFFLAIELLTHRKCVASLSSRNVQA